MSWGTVEEEPEVHRWLEQLKDEAFGRAAFYIDLLAEKGPLLDEPHSRQLAGKVRELRFTLRDRTVRISYYLASGQRAILLTVFHKSRRKERKEIERAVEAYQRCVREQHDAEEDS